jgi:hypothetical protein
MSSVKAIDTLCSVVSIETRQRPCLQNSFDSHRLQCILNRPSNRRILQLIAEWDVVGSQPNPIDGPWRQRHAMTIRNTTQTPQTTHNRNLDAKRTTTQLISTAITAEFRYGARSSRPSARLGTAFAELPAI